MPTWRNSGTDLPILKEFEMAKRFAAALSLLVLAVTGVMSAQEGEKPLAKAKIGDYVVYKVIELTESGSVK
jgi:hypothetical protein